MLAPGAWAAGNYKVLYYFTGGDDGGSPGQGVILDAAGNLYGTAQVGGTSGNGVVFELTPNSDGSWTESALYSFSGGSDGSYPYGQVTFDANGNLYGTTWYGGDSSSGIVFQLVPNSDGTWTEKVLYSFPSGSDESQPTAGVIVDTKGTLYGTTLGGGTQGLGVVYKLTPKSDGSWKYGVLHNFKGGKDGSYPGWSSLSFDTAGNLYGTTWGGGNPDCRGPWGKGCGMIFELVPNADGSWKEKVLFRFGNGQYQPAGPLVFDRAGRLYGIAIGWNGNYGNVFQLTLGKNGKWTERILHKFTGNQDGAYPSSGVLFNTAGDLYGTTVYGEDENGDCCPGQVFKLVPHAGGWTKQAVHRFQGAPQDGVNTRARVVFDAAGNLYGTTCDGGSGNGGDCVDGSSGAGVVFEIKR
jgi:uncharacterized repeat protein (TIGR03803 family)